MRVHRSAHVRNFTVLPNAMLQYRQLSYTARGLLADLLSRPDGWREDGRHMADTSPQGRGAIRKALKELTDAGFYRVEKIRMPDGTIITETHVYDTAQLALPGATRPVSGEATTGGADALVKNRHKGTSLPAEQAVEPVLADEPQARTGGREEHPEEEADEQPVLVPDDQVREAVAALFRVIRPEPRLRLGQSEAEELAPLVAQWLERGATQADLAQTLLPGLPAPMHSAVSVLRYRLERKMPPVQSAVRPAAARYSECAKCHDPVPQPGICRACAGLGARTVGVGGGEAATRSGAARARDALRAARTAGLHLGSLAAAQ
ncbi:hypothetical protein [Kitasatospora purpeofusca]|uniref:hypothetical protein n=1 Tax=Kitasatospora purpeofusca TaxID=67352 RepID=UPI00224D19D9|nr:hypothetical protein [Kitasatospora purpeofusca]MCX4753473.1 hypothetical protein [Kitasatospora purpeofusca]WSR32969.1 hypothetical protein OG715_19450 [Kitasatospora purpeofusca]